MLPEVAKISHILASFCSKQNLLGNSHESGQANMNSPFVPCQRSRRSAQPSAKYAIRPVIVSTESCQAKVLIVKVPGRTLMMKLSPSVTCRNKTSQPDGGTYSMLAVCHFKGLQHAFWLGKKKNILCSCCNPHIPCWLLTFWRHHKWKLNLFWRYFIHPQETLFSPSLGVC